jgi:hypothetical protein
MMGGGAVILFLLFINKSDKIPAGYTILGVLVFLLGLLIWSKTGSKALKKKAKRKRDDRYWFVEENDNENEE